MTWTPNRIVLISHGRHDEAQLDADAYPGMILADKTNGHVIPHNVAGGAGPLKVLKEQALSGKTTTDKVASGDVGPFVRPTRGDLLLCLLQNGQNVAAGAALQSAGDGTLAASSGSALYGVNADSANVTNTTAETTFSNGSYTLPANTLAAGDVVRIRGEAQVTGVNATDTQRIRVYFGGTNLVIDVPATNYTANDRVQFSADVTVRSVGATGSFVSRGNYAGGAAAAALKQYDLGPTTIDTTVAEVVKVTATASVANAGDVVKLTQFSVSLDRSGGTNALLNAAEAIDNSGGTGTSGFNSAAFIRVVVP
jgi:hypothetical protein